MIHGMKQGRFTLFVSELLSFDSWYMSFCSWMKGQVKGIWALCGSAESRFWSLALLVSKLKEAALCFQGCLWRIFSSEEYPVFLFLQLLARKSQSICDCWELLDCNAISNTTTLPLNNFSRNDAIITSYLALPKGNTLAIAQPWEWYQMMVQAEDRQ